LLSIWLFGKIHPYSGVSGSSHTSGRKENLEQSSTRRHDAGHRPVLRRAAAERCARTRSSATAPTL
jgi:hypothetical protein